MEDLREEKEKKVDKVFTTEDTENALFSLAVDLMAGWYKDGEDIVCRKITRKGKILH